MELKGPFNYTAREEAGIPRDWLVLHTKWISSFKFQLFDILFQFRYDGTNTSERKRELAEV